MAVRALLPAVLAALSPWSASGAYTPSKNVIVASDKDFDAKVVNSDKSSFVWFLAPWCGHCKKLQGDYAQVADAYAGSDSIQIVEVDCTAGGEQSCQKAGVKGYPSLKYWTPSIKGGEFSGGRDAASMKSFISEKMVSCNVKTLKGCAKNQIEFIEKHKASSLDDVTALKKEKDDALKELKKERSKAKQELAEKEKTWGRNERNIQKALGLIKQLEKQKKDDEAKAKKAEKAKAKDEM